MLHAKIRANDVLIVVAKYKEDSSWVVQKQVPYIIYDKSKDVKNVGRESETYLRHIINNYENLPRWLICLQGDPFPHVDARRRINRTNIIQRIMSHKLSNKFEPFFKRPSCREQRVFHMKPRYGPWGWVNVGEFIERWFVVQRVKSFTFANGGCFIVPRDAILFRSLRFYKEIIKTVNYDINPVEGHFLERSWRIMFDQKTKDRITHRIPI